ncbi:carboxymuconolactone decarboxylase family protein [Nonomuraea basaltis]|uniref:carboxymuconolactone decarboxylase family protein n=1 Tax=Nonomuraea basaltis TaxID=2495887 RepID=UPI00110C4F0D|nr:carboxymuconolactone decarboxylase family protein [Nonomuraea basaltis]TMR89993.1 carboxymuconolactone decarboxylase family protein [Nonomuraea basaltis]
MTQRINFAKNVPEAHHHFIAVEKLLHESELPTTTIELLKLRASQINGCGYWVDMRSRDLKRAGESDERIWSLVGGRAGRSARWMARRRRLRGDESSCARTV